MLSVLQSANPINLWGLVFEHPPTATWRQVAGLVKV
jgi:hypothetical protein